MASTTPGQIVGGYHPAANGFQSFLYAGGAFSVVNSGGGFTNEAFSISNNGKIAGYQGGTAATEGYVYAAGAYTAIDDAAFPANSTLATGVNNAGVVVGVYGPTGGNTSAHSFVDVGGVINTFAAPGWLTTNVSGINDAGVIVGGVSNDGFATGSGFVYQNGVFTIVKDPRAVLTFVEGISNRGQLVGYDFNADGIQGIFAANAVPEPASWAIMLIGVTLLGCAARQRRGRSVAMV